MEKETIISSDSLIIMGGSSGSLEALLIILPLLEKRLLFPIIIVLHRNFQSDNSLIDLFASRTSLPVKEADEKDELQAGTIYIAPADYHLLIEQNKTISLDASDKVNFSRPSIDVSFASAAEVYKEKLVAVLLSGANADGSNGIGTILEYGGTVAVQDPQESLVNYMPKKAIQQHKLKNIFTAVKIAEWINSL
jgi:two-component system chemotaxis response regulator CheB